MTDKKLTYGEIVKALECCKSDTALCTECPYYKIGECIEKMCADSIDQINRQKTENENLKVENQSLRSAANSLKMHYEEAQAEIERLKSCVKTEKEVREIAKRTMEPLVKEITREQIDIAVKLAKAEACKEFAEKLKEQAEVYTDSAEDVFILAVGISKIDNLLKELMGENND